MSRPAGSARRSGDPRRRAAATAAPPTTDGTRLRLALVLATVLVLVVVGALALRTGGDEPDAEALGHAEVACDYTSKAEQAAEVTSDARLAAAVLLLDRAILASARAAGTDPSFADLDDAVRAVHAAGHRGDPTAYDASLLAALEACRSALP